MITGYCAALQYISGRSDSHLMKRIKDRYRIEWRRKIFWNYNGYFFGCLFVSESEIKITFQYQLQYCSTIYLRSVGLTSQEKNQRQIYNWVTKKNVLKLQCIFFWLFVCIEVRNQSNISVLVTALQYISGLSNSHLMKRIKDRD